MRVKRLFRSPQLFPPKPPEDSLKAPNNPTRPASFLRQFSPQHSPVARLFRGKKGLFCPQRPPYPPFCPPERPRFAPAPPVFCPARARMKPRLAPVLPGPHSARAHPLGPPEAPRVRLFLPARARFRPPCAARTPEGYPACRLNHPAVHRQPARRRRPPTEGQPAPPRHGLEAGNSDCRGRLSLFAVKKCATPRGGSNPWA